MNTNYTIEQAFVSKISYNSPIQIRPSVEQCRAANRHLSVSVDIDRCDKANTFLTAITARIECNSGREKVFFFFEMTYLVIVRFESVEGLSDSQLGYVLYVDVPQREYDKVRNAVWNITAQSGLEPIMLPDHNFSEEARNPDDNIDYRWAIRELYKDKRWGSDFMNILSSFTSNPYDYYSSPFYRHYFRFIRPVEYSHPDFEQCADELWDILFQLLFANFDVQCELVASDNGLPQLRFSYLKFENKQVSELTLPELKLLLLALVSDIMSLVLPHICYVDIDQTYSDSLPTDCQPTLDELMTLYRGTDNDTQQLFAHRTHQRILASR